MTTKKQKKIIVRIVRFISRWPCADEKDSEIVFVRSIRAAQLLCKNKNWSYVISEMGLGPQTYRWSGEGETWKKTESFSELPDRLQAMR